MNTQTDLGGLHLKLTADIAELEAMLTRAKALAAETAAAMSTSANQTAAAYKNVAAAATQATAASRSFGIGGGGSGGGMFGARGGVGRASPFPQQQDINKVSSLTARLGPLVAQLREVSKYAGIGLGLIARASAVIGVATAAIFTLGKSIEYVLEAASSGKGRLDTFKNSLDLSDVAGTVSQYTARRKELEKSVFDTYSKLQNSNSPFKRLPWNVIADYIRVRSAMKDIANQEADYARSATRTAAAQAKRLEKAKKESEELKKQLDLLKQIQDQQRGRFTLYDVVFAVNANTEILKDIASRIR